MKKLSYLCAALLPLALLSTSVQSPISAQQQGQQQTPVPPQSASMLRHTVTADLLKYSPDMNLGEVLGIAVNSQGIIAVLNHPGSAMSGPIQGNATTQILLFGPDGRFLREIGQRVYGLAYAHQVRYDKYDNLWVVDKGAHSVVKFDPQGYVTMNLGRREEGFHGIVELPSPAQAKPATGGMLGGPSDVAWDADDNIFVSDGYVHSRVAKFDKHGNFLKGFGSYGNGPGQFSTPHAMVADRDGNLYVADRGNSRIQVLDRDLNFKRIMYLNVPYPADYQPPFNAVDPTRPVRDRTAPWAMCMTNTTPQYMFVADVEPGRIYKMALDGKILGWFGSAGRQVGQYNWTHSLDCSQPDTVYVGDMNNWRVQKVTLQP